MKKEENQEIHQSSKIHLKYPIIQKEYPTRQPGQSAGLHNARKHKSMQKILKNRDHQNYQKINIKTHSPHKHQTHPKKR